MYTNTWHAHILEYQNMTFAVQIMRYKSSTTRWRRESSAVTCDLTPGYRWCTSTTHYGTSRVLLCMHHSAYCMFIVYVLALRWWRLQQELWPVTAGSLSITGIVFYCQFFYYKDDLPMTILKQYLLIAVIFFIAASFVSQLYSVWSVRLRHNTLTILFLIFK